jgi:glucokinase
MKKPDFPQSASGAVNVLGIDIGGTHFRAALFAHDGQRLPVSESETNLSGGREWMLDEFRKRSSSLIEQSAFPVKACGISFGGPVDYGQQRVSSLHVAGWRSFPLAEWVKDTLKLECQVDNDANAGAIGEYRFGAGRGADSIVYVTLSTGIGGGVVCGGKVFRGKDCLAGEIGHIRLSDGGAACSCGGRGCLETLSSGTAIAHHGRSLAKRKPELLPRTVEISGGRPDQITAEAVFRAAREGEQSARFIVREAARWLARGLLTVMRILNPDRIILGGGVAQAGSGLLDPVLEYLDDLGAPMLECSTEVRLAELGNYSPLYGAAALGIELLAS